MTGLEQFAVGVCGIALGLAIAFAIVLPSRAASRRRR